MPTDKPKFCFELISSTENTDSLYFYYLHKMIIKMIIIFLQLQTYTNKFRLFFPDSAFRSQDS